MFLVISGWGALKMQNLPNHKICYREAQLSSGQPGLKLTFEQLDCSSCKFTKEQNIFTFITKNFLAFLFGKLLPCFSFCHFMKSSLASLLSSLYYDLFWFIALTNSFITLCKSTVAEVWYTLNHSKALIKIDEYLRYDLQRHVGHVHNRGVIVLHLKFNTTTENWFAFCAALVLTFVFNFFFIN